jgi:hypothetical protein
VIDYINDPIDLRPKSSTLEGVPDEILLDITRSLAKYVAQNCAKGRENVG